MAERRAPNMIAPRTVISVIAGLLGAMAAIMTLLRRR
jgi:hypothetical protein